ncbi:MAG: LysM peptidoglycan-binding domain-containing protein [Massiliimalia sp.]
MQQDLGKFRFKGHEFSYLPRQFSIERKRNLQHFLLPGLAARGQDLGFYPRVIAGEGELFGENLSQQYETLYQLFLSEGSGLFCFPGIRPFYCYFEEFAVTGRAGPKMLSYRFVFREDCEKNETSHAGEWCVAQKGDTLSAIAARYGKSLSQLIQKNPGLSGNDLTEGTIVWLN